MKLLTDYIREYPNYLEDDFCRHVIEKFEVDERKYKGVTLDPSTEENYKVSTDLNISLQSDWKEEDNIFYHSLAKGLKDYQDFLGNLFVLREPITDSGYQIQRTTTNGYYKWHHDFTCQPTENPRMMMARDLTYIFYLNDEFEGGHTEFFDSGVYSYKPKTGSLLIFPANKLWRHQGMVVTSGTKYLATGWIYTEQHMAMA